MSQLVDLRKVLTVGNLTAMRNVARTMNSWRVLDEIKNVPLYNLQIDVARLENSIRAFKQSEALRDFFSSHQIYCAQKLFLYEPHRALSVRSDTLEHFAYLHGYAQNPPAAANGARTFGCALLTDCMHAMGRLGPAVRRVDIPPEPIDERAFLKRAKRLLRRLKCALGIYRKFAIAALRSATKKSSSSLQFITGVALDKALANRGAVSEVASVALNVLQTKRMRYAMETVSGYSKQRPLHMAF